jgi:TPR repeat protein
LALTDFALMFYDGSFLKKDYKQAAKYFRMAFDKNNARAAFYLGLMYEEGHGVIANMDESLKYYKVAAEHGSTDAQIRLGDFYKGKYFQNSMLELANKKNKKTTPDDSYLQALQFYRSAAMSGVADAQYEYAVLVTHKKIAIEYEQAVKMLLQAANQNHPDSLYQLGKVYERGLLGIVRNLEKAQIYFDLAAKNGHTTAKQKAKNMLD